MYVKEVPSFNTIGAAFLSEWHRGASPYRTLKSNPSQGDICDHTCIVSNRPFAGSGHMVRNKLHWDANDAVGLPKQRNSYQSSPTFLCFESPITSFASQCNLFRTM